MTVYTYIGLTPRFLSSGRPVTFGTELQESDLALADDSIKTHLVSPPSKAPKAAPAAPAPADEADAPAPKEIVNTGNRS